MTDKKKTILEAVEKLTDTYRKEELFLGRDRERLPNKKEIINFIKDMRSIIFPGYFSVDSSASVFPEHYVAYRLNDLYDCLQEQIEIAFLYQGEEEQKAKEHAEQITERFFANVPEIQRMLLTDLQSILFDQFLEFIPCTEEIFSAIFFAGTRISGSCGDR